jgi:hypothetical protein
VSYRAVIFAAFFKSDSCSKEEYHRTVLMGVQMVTGETRCEVGDGLYSDS